MPREDESASYDPAPMTAQTTDSGLRNVAIIAHVDHGKTSLLDALLAHAGAVGRTNKLDADALVMDSNPLERERGITILSKNCAIDYRDADGSPVRINLIDTPGHADFGGEVERVLRMADGVLLLVDAFEGPMPQTRFVLEKALGLGLQVLVVVNKCDRPDARPDDVITEVFDLLVALDADDETLDFPVIYASARDRWASDDPNGGADVEPLLRAIMTHVPPPVASVDEPLQLLVTNIDYSEYVGRIAIGRVFAGVLEAGAQVAVCRRDESVTKTRALEVHRFLGLGRESVADVGAGDICAVQGLSDFDIGDTICAPDFIRPMVRVAVDEPTLHMIFRVNDSPNAGREGKLLTSRQIEDRLRRETQSDVALRVEPGEGPESFRVSGRGLLHLGVLIETMRREGFELCIGRPEVIERVVDGTRCEPVERMTVLVPENSVGPVMELIGSRGGDVQTVEARGDRMQIEAEMPARGLIGLRSRMLTATGGEAILDHAFARYAPVRTVERSRGSGVMVATEAGQARSYALLALAERGTMFIDPQDPIYGGQVVGEHNRANDLGVNVVKNKAFSNVRESNKDATVNLKAPRRLTLEEALEYIERDEFVEVTPSAVRLRKRVLDPGQRKRIERQEKMQEQDRAASR